MADRFFITAAGTFDRYIIDGSANPLLILDPFGRRRGYEQNRVIVAVEEISAAFRLRFLNAGSTDVAIADQRVILEAAERTPELARAGFARSARGLVNDLGRAAFVMLAPEFLDRADIVALSGKLGRAVAFPKPYMLATWVNIATSAAAISAAAHVASYNDLDEVVQRALDLGLTVES